MREIIIFFLVSVIVLPFYGQVGIGTTTPHNSALLDVTSTTRGFLPPRMTTVERNAIINPSPGLMIFNTTTNSLEIFAGSGWGTITFSSAFINKLLGGTGQETPWSIQQTNDGGYIIAGNSRSSSSGDVTGTSHNPGGYEFWVVKIDASGNISWNKLLGGNGHDLAYSIRQTDDGGYIVAGHSTSSANGDVTSINHGGEDFWIVKLDGFGNILWNKLLGGTANDWAKAIQKTSDGGYIVVGYSLSSAIDDVTDTNHGDKDYWIVKLDGVGNILWNKLLGGAGSDSAHSIQQTSDGGFIVAGHSTSSTNGDVNATNHGASDYWILKLDGSGNIIWNKLLGGSGYDQAKSIQQTNDGGYIVAGASTSSANGNITVINHGSYDYWILKLDGSGNIIWNKLLGGTGSDVAESILQTSDGGYIVVGYSTSSANGDVTATNHGFNFPDYWIVKLDGSGNISWNKLLGANNNELAYSIEQTTDGGYIVAGYSSSSGNSGDISGSNHGSFDYWIIKLDKYGNPY